jgi:hypothetical protein
MPEQMRRTWARWKFTIDKIPHQIIYYTLGNQIIRLSILKLLAPFPRLKVFLREYVVSIQQAFVQKRILYQRNIHPTMVIKGRRQASPVSPESLVCQDSQAPSVPEILRRIERELE